MWTFTYQLRDTTHLNGFVYHRLYQRQEQVSPDWQLEDNGSMYREENGIVYMLDSRHSGVERIVYNFNIDSVGQLIQLSDLTYEVLEIDSITLMNGERHRRIKVKDAGRTATYTHWIDGIGALEDPFDPNYIWQDQLDLNQYILRCASKGLVQVYQAQMGEPCSVFIVNTEETDFSRSLEIFPNPTTGKLFITGRNNHLAIREVHVRRANGALVLTTQSSELDLSSVPSGLYFLEIVLENGASAWKRVVKE